MSDNSNIIRLENGVQIVCEPMASIQSASVGVWVNIGTRAETKNNNGVAHFLEHLVFKGAGSRNAKEIAEDAENRGIYLNAATSYEKTGFFARCLGEDASFALDMCADLVLSPKLDAKDIELEKNVVLHEIKEANDDADDRANVLNQAASFKDQSLGMPILGDEVSLLELSQEKFVDFHKHYKNPNNIIIGIAGAFNRDRLLDLARARFGDLQSEALTIYDKANSTSYAETEGREIEQLQLSLSFDGLPEKQNGLFANRLFCSILGGGMSSRLFQDLREKRGLVYGIDAYEEKFSELNRIGISAGCDPQNTAEVLSRINQHIVDLALEGPSEAEMRRGKKALETSLMISLENPSSRLTSSVYQLAKYSKTLSIDDISKSIRALCPEDIVATAKHAIEQKKRAIGAVGPEIDTDIFQDFIN